MWWCVFVFQAHWNWWTVQSSWNGQCRWITSSLLCRSWTSQWVYKNSIRLFLVTACDRAVFDIVTVPLSPGRRQRGGGGGVCLGWSDLHHRPQLRGGEVSVWRERQCFLCRWDLILNHTFLSDPSPMYTWFTWWLSKWYCQYSYSECFQLMSPLDGSVGLQAHINTLHPLSQALSNAVSPISARAPVALWEQREIILLSNKQDYRNGQERMKFYLSHAL